MRKHKSIALYLSYIVILTFLVFGSITIVRGINNLRAARRGRAVQQALYLSEAGIRTVGYNLTQAISNYENESTSSVIATTPKDLSTLTYWAPPSGILPSDFTTTYTCRIVGSEQTITDSLGIITKRLTYEIAATAAHNTYDVSVTLKQLVNRDKTYIFQYAVFYADDLEMLPGANMTLSGKIHSNNDIYLDSDYTLTINADYLCSAASIYNRRKDSTALPAGNVTIKVAGSSPATYQYMEQSGVILDSLNANWTVGSQTRWNGTVKSSVHGVTTLTAPAVESIQPDGYYADNAGLKIIKNSDGTWSITSGSTTLALTDFPTSTITESTFRDNRAGKNVTTIDIDISKLNTSGYFPSNGLLYVSRQDSTSTNPNGVRLKSGSTLLSSLTTVSDDPVYIQGDFNTVSKKGSAIICDAVNILSNAWDDTKSTYSLSSRVATSTTVNSAFVAGNVPTPDGGGTYSGGLENYPRLHETWSGKTLYIRGSFVELWASEKATASWKYGGSVYTAPTRNWDYDTDFNNSSNLPPFTPFTVSISPVAWWRESNS